MISSIQIHRGRYHDSVRLMQASRAVGDVAGVHAALVAMATELNLDLLADMGFDTAEADDWGADDLLVAIRAEDEAALEVAREVLAQALVARPSPEGGWDAPDPRTIGHAARDADVALISMPGEHAYAEAAEALELGLHVMVFSDNVSIEHEMALKKRAAQRGLLVMGPDCGTTIINGVGLGFANAVLPGPVSMVGASGTGIQQLCCLLDDAGVGVRHAIGTGSRDLSGEVGGRSTKQAMHALDADPATDVIVVISKPPAEAVAAEVRDAAAACDTPVVVVFMGDTTLEDGSGEVLAVLGREPRAYSAWPASRSDRRPGTIRGLFSGGTLRDDARFVVERALGATVGTSEGSSGHVFVDYGDDRYTRGRAHPMIDQTVRLDRLAEAARDETVGIALLDVVLGHGANPDPAGELAPAIEQVVDAGVAVIASLCGTKGDPQGLARQAATLNSAGAAVYVSNAAAARHAAGLAARMEER
ncbi:MAG: FdrA family protein [Acidimicrobiia bacterium]|nr:FdrA family protein [Acidimicrobiia bacterium]